MTDIEFVAYLAQAFTLGVALYAGWYTYTRPTRSNIYIIVFFALLVLIITYTWSQRIFELAPGTFVDLVPPLLILSLPYVLLRLAREFSWARPLYMRISEIGLAGAYTLVIVPGTENTFALLAVLIYFAVVSAYAARQFHLGSVDANGITQKRLRSLSIASVLLGATLFTVIFTTVLSGIVSDLTYLGRQLMLALSAMLFLFGFAPPQFIRRSWQEPALRTFLRETLHLPRWSSTEAVVEHIEQTAATTIGAPNATIGLWNPTTGKIDFHHNSFAPGETIGGKAFQAQRPVMSLDTLSDDPESREVYERGQAFAVMAAPISVDAKRVGVIALYSPNPPIFAEDDLSLLRLLADHIGIILENRQYLQDESELAAREEATRLKEDFLAVAAHDLKTPLTTIIGTGQYLERRLHSLGEDSVELRSMIRLNRESKRLQALVQGLLDTSRIEQGRLAINRETVSLRDTIDEVLSRTEVTNTHRVRLNQFEDLVGEFDAVRVQQVIENLIENAGKYSSEGSTIEISAWSEEDNAHITISDHGKGIAPDDKDQIFDRFYRGPDSETSHSVGIGLGLFICKEIVELHGGRIWVESELGNGSTFHVVVPCGPVTERAKVDGTGDSGSGRRSGHLTHDLGHSVIRRVPGEDSPKWTGGAGHN